MNFLAQESACRATQFFAFRSAALELWGDFGWREVEEQLPEEVRLAVLGKPLAPVDWILERHMMSLSEAVFAGPAGRREPIYRGFVGTMIACGFGRIRRFLVQFAPPELLLDKSPELWRHDHTHGELRVAKSPHGALVELSGHVHVTTSLSRLTAAEAFRSALAYTRARHVTVEHELAGDVLRVDLRWS
jgi:hypothetical protein